MENKFDEENIKGISLLGDVLQHIHNRLVAEGYFLPGGKIWNIFKCVPNPICEFELE